jgi:hypothetical protein
LWTALALRQAIWRKGDPHWTACGLLEIDPEARYGAKRDLTWVGYKAHVTETCDPDEPHLITHVETTPATTHDGQVVEAIHADLAHKELLPSEHIVDTALCGLGSPGK